MNAAQYLRRLARRSAMWLSRSSVFLRGAWRTIPVETAVVAMSAIGAIGLVHRFDGDGWLRFFIAGILLTPLALAAHRLGRRVQLVATVLAAAGVLTALAFALPTQGRLHEPAFSWPFRLSLLAAMVVPFVAAGRRFTHFVRRFFEETTTWGLLWLGALAALGVVVLALDELFDLRIETYGSDAGIVMTGAFILVYLHRLLADDPAVPGRMPELWRRLATTIGAPFVSVMLVILVVYEAVVIAHGELPRNMLSPLILGAGFVGYLSTLVIASVLAEGGGGVLSPAERHRWARNKTILVMRAFPIVVLVLLPMAGWALWVRVEDHGFTPFRVVRAMGLLCLAVLSLASAIRWLRGRGPLTWEVPAAVLVFSLAAAFGPASAVQLTIRSQRDRLGHELDGAGATRVVGAESSQRIPVGDERFAAMVGSLRALNDLGGMPALRLVLSGSVELCTERWREAECLKRLGIYEQNDFAPIKSIELSARMAEGRAAVAAGRLAFVKLDREIGNPAPGPADDGLSLLADHVAVYIAGKEIARASLTELLAAAMAGQNLPPRTLEVVGPDGSVLADLVVQTIYLRRHGDDAPEATTLTAAVVWRR
jgi:hypothetical protein